MAQLSIFEKQKHYSKKDFTCSIGKYDVIYFTFRNQSWKRFTITEKIAVYIGQTGALRFDDPACGKGIILTLKKGTGRPDVVENTRYVQLSGKSWPGILEVVRRTAGSYDFPSATGDIQKPAEKKPEEQAKKKEESVTPIMEHAETIPEWKQRRACFIEDLAFLLSGAQSKEERVAIFVALGSLYASPKTNQAPEERPAKDKKAPDASGEEWGEAEKRFEI